MPDPLRVGLDRGDRADHYSETASVLRVPIFPEPVRDGDYQMMKCE